MVIERMGSTGNPAVQQIDKISWAAASKSLEETPKVLDRYGIKLYISSESTLFIRFLEAVAETFAIAPVATGRLPTLGRDELIAIAESAFGMWADREDIGDTGEYVRSLRARWKKRLEVVESD